MICCIWQTRVLVKQLSLFHCSVRYNPIVVFTTIFFIFFNAYDYLLCMCHIKSHIGKWRGGVGDSAFFPPIIRRLVKWNQTSASRRGSIFIFIANVNNKNHDGLPSKLWFFRVTLLLSFINPRRKIEGVITLTCWCVCLSVASQLANE